ncbi:unnamed protein product [Peronospora belbahrii]|uniref:Uncharacterized protein n=1 Tax=Peronospora belbahrii TaxID=622444 RepID=A0AAU9KQH0_9STRA|nr:unnamed protein product [Peronospora belbahrii]
MYMEFTSRLTSSVDIPKNPAMRWTEWPVVRRSSFLTHTLYIKSWPVLKSRTRALKVLFLTSGRKILPYFLISDIMSSY